MEDFIKKCLKWLNNNKGAIIALLVGILSMSEMAFQWIMGEHTTYIGGLSLPACIGVALSLVIGGLTHGFNTNATVDAMKRIKEITKNDSVNGLTYADRVKIGKRINELEKELKALGKEYKLVIENVELLGVKTSEDIAKYQEYTRKKQSINDKIKAFKQRLGE